MLRQRGGGSPPRSRHSGKDTHVAVKPGCPFRLRPAAAHSCALAGHKGGPGRIRKGE